MNFLRNIFKQLKKFILFKPVSPAIDAAEAALLGTTHTTEEAPHFVDSIDLKKYMGFVLLALFPSTGAAIYYYGLHVVWMILVSYAVGAAVEVAFAVFRKREIEEGFFVTGLIFPLVLPPNTPLWVVGVGAAFGIFFGKEVFGGTGRNIFNPALVGRLFITLAFPSIMTTFPAWADAITEATPLAAFKEDHILIPLKDLLGGNCSGSIGETFKIGIIAGGLFLMFSKVSNWRIPLFYLGAVAAFSAIGNHFMPEKIAPPLFQLLSGGLLYGAMFMATDPVTSPFTKIGKCIFGIFCGFFTVLIRGFSGYVEGVMFSIVLMNAFVPLIDHMILSQKYKAKKT